MWLLIAFLTVPLIEIGLFIQVGGWLGLWPTLAIVVLTAIAGTVLMRAQGAMALDDLRTSFTRAGDPTEPLAHGAMILVAGVLLLTPGFFTDALGFALLLPPVRRVVFARVRDRIRVHRFESAPQGPRPQPPGGTTIEGDYSEVDPPEHDATDTPRHTPRPTSGWTRRDH